MAVKNKETMIDPVYPVFWIDGGYGAFQKVGSAYNLYDADGNYFSTVYSFSEVCRRLEERGKTMADYIKREERLPDLPGKKSKAHWIERIEPDEDPFFQRKYYCSACGDWQTYGKTKYCPNCGERMVDDG